MPTPNNWAQRLTPQHPTAAMIETLHANIAAKVKHPAVINGKPCFVYLDADVAKDLGESLYVRDFTKSNQNSFNTPLKKK